MLIKYESRYRNKPHSEINKCLSKPLHQISQEKENKTEHKQKIIVQPQTEQQKQIPNNIIHSTQHERHLIHTADIKPTLKSNTIVKHKNSENKCKGVIVRNTPVDLYQKYKNDWEKFKYYIPGENARERERKEVRRKLQHKPEPKENVRILIAIAINNVVT